MSRLVVVVVAVLGSSAAATPRAGRVVRVERGTRQTAIPRPCVIQSSLHGICIGKRPAIGERIVVIDTEQVLGGASITDVTPYVDPCGQGVLWTVQVRLEFGDLSAVSMREALGVIDAVLDLRDSKLVAPERSPLADVPLADVRAIDTNGDGRADLEFVGYSCDDSGAPTAARASSTGSCVDVWVATGRGFARVHQDRIRQCP